MTMRNDIQGIIRDVLARLDMDASRGVEITRTAVSCPDSPDTEGLSRRDMLGRLSLLLAGAAAFKLQGCGACNDFAGDEDDAGADAGDAGDAGCILDCATECTADCSNDTCSSDTCTTDCSSDTCTTDCSSTDCAMDCQTESCTGDCTTDSSSFF